MELEIMLLEISQAKKAKCQTFLLICGTWTQNDNDEDYTSV
jgi:hypothetical protein